MVKIDNNENYDICSKCGGKCCKNYGGTFHPDELGENFTLETLTQIITERGDISLDWYVSDEPGYFLRVRHKDSPIIDPSWGDVECIHLTEKGCDLPFNERPYGCKKLTPSNDECLNHVSKYESAMLWKDYQDILEEIDNDSNLSRKNQINYADEFDNFFMKFLGIEENDSLK